MSEMRCVVAAVAPAWGARALPRRGAAGGALGRLRRRGGAVLLPPPRMGRPGQTLEDWCPSHGREDLLEEWDEPVRGTHEVTRASNQKVWWKCGKEECGHRWGAAISNRTSNGTGCPACAGKVPTATHNFEVYCQETGRSELLGEWADRSRRPKDFTPASGAKVPWKCGECGWGWEARIASRTSSNPRGCPACAGRVVTPTNTLAVWCVKTGRADLLGEWAHPDKAPTEFTPASAAKIPWQCGECGWGWVACISDRTRSSHPTGCPKCNPSGRKPGKVISP